MTDKTARLFHDRTGRLRQSAFGALFLEDNTPIYAKMWYIEYKVIPNNEFHYVSSFFRHVSTLFSTIFPKIVVVYYLREVNL